MRLFIFCVLFLLHIWAFLLLYCCLTLVTSCVRILHTHTMSYVYRVLCACLYLRMQCNRILSVFDYVTRWCCFATGVMACSRNVHEYQWILPGDVWIFSIKVIGWHSYFPILIGVETDISRLASYWTLISCVKYKLPCLIGLQGASELFNTGDLVHLDSETDTLG